jgi:MFS family permease
MTSQTVPLPDANLTASSTRIAPLLAAMFILNAFGYAAVGAVVSVLLPTQVRLAAGDGAPAALGLITGVAAIAALAMPPIVGILSDRTRTRWGRRSPFILAGGIAAAGALVLLSLANSIALLLVGWFLVQAFLSMGMNLILSTIPERIPARRHGLASTVQGLGLPIGAIAGVQIGAATVDSLTVGYALLAGLFLAASVVCAILLRNPSKLDDVVPERRSPAIELRDIFASLKARDFRWVFISRTVVFLGQSMISAFSLYILQDYITLPEGLTAAQGVATTTTIALVGTVVATVISGPLVDRFGHHRGFVLVSSITVALAIVLPFLWPTWTAFLIQASVSGFAVGMYLGVDLALATLVLPKTGDEGRDLGVFHIAVMLPQVAAPFFASLVVTFLGGYASLFLASAVVALLGSVAVLRVRRESLPTRAELRAAAAVRA